MPRPLPAALLAAACLAAGALLAPRPLPAQNDGGESARGDYRVAGGTVPVLLDAATGETWALARVGPGEHVWLPCDRVTDPDAAKAVRDRLRQAGGDGTPDAPAGGGSERANLPPGGAYFPGDLLGGDLIGGDLIGGSLIGSDAIHGDLIGGNAVSGDLVEGVPLDSDDPDAKPGEEAAKE